MTIKFKIYIHHKLTESKYLILYRSKNKNDVNLRQRLRIC